MFGVLSISLIKPGNALPSTVASELRSAGEMPSLTARGVPLLFNQPFKLLPLSVHPVSSANRLKRDKTKRIPRGIRIANRRAALLLLTRIIDIMIPIAKASFSTTLTAVEPKQQEESQPQQEDQVIYR